MAKPELSTSDWAVLAAVAEGETHGFRLAALFGAGSELGQIWRIQRPQVYRALEHLEQQGFIVEVGREAGEGGPPRVLYRISDRGRERLEQWLRLPVTRLRFGRSDLRLKLAFLLRSGRSCRDLLTLQREVYRAQLQSLEVLSQSARGVVRVSLLWRLEMAQAGLRYVERLLEDDPP
ncbi:PadR family transcriptional regulator [Calidithermus timidus]|uniref:PadR family transcriptional regulator n=1 Tax=Calidithermus timidus TaxID=307124 RepID=UPI00037351FA|nr:PadR family transcriptional regulator [Calidithermus timidus]